MTERHINIRKPYLRLIQDGTKTIEVRVGYPSMKKITAGQLLRFVSGDDSCLTRVVKLVEYPSFEAMVDAEDPAAIGGDMDSDALIAACQEIYPPEKEALGVLTIHLERVLS
ncbi:MULTISPECIES: ASCH domain-containing protein [unclassified Streptomyces]|uniref:ASCH domain-containing protein n=1 Tax=Streptomyces sp. NBC_00060 TaxID=2975636 RepID=A0AAU2GXM5_9ACTN